MFFKYVLSPRKFQLLLLQLNIAISRKLISVIKLSGDKNFDFCLCSVIIRADPYSAVLNPAHFPIEEVKIQNLPDVARVEVAQNRDQTLDKNYSDMWIIDVQLSV